MKRRLYIEIDPNYPKMDYDRDSEIYTYTSVTLQIIKLCDIWIYIGEILLNYDTMALLNHRYIMQWCMIKRKFAMKISHVSWNVFT